MKGTEKAHGVTPQQGYVILSYRKQIAYIYIKHNVIVINHLASPDNSKLLLRKFAIISFVSVSSNHMLSTSPITLVMLLQSRYETIPKIQRAVLHSICHFTAIKIKWTLLMGIEFKSL